MLILFVGLVVDVSYGIVTYGTPYGCRSGTYENNGLPQGANFSALAEPCFYVYYFGIVGGSSLVILVLAWEGSIAGGPLLAVTRIWGRF
jgi:hypothetical protein